jgi:peroxiredoxin
MTSPHLNVGDTVAPHELQALSGETVPVPDPGQLVHLELRRFAGCPVCNLHLRSVVVRADELRAAGIREVVVFHSSADDLRKYQAELPFDVIPDPDRKLYTEFGVEKTPRAILNPKAWGAIFKGLGRSIGATARREEHAPPVKPAGGSTGLPGDFLIASDGRVIASKYGEHAYDQWTVDEVLALAKSAPAAEATPPETEAAAPEAEAAAPASEATAPASEATAPGEEPAQPSAPAAP